MFLLTQGNYSVIKLEHSYSRRSQSTVRSLRWRQIATIDTNNLNEAIDEANEYLQNFSIRGRWKVEGVGTMAGIEHELSLK